MSSTRLLSTTYQTHGLRLDEFEVHLLAQEAVDGILVRHRGVISYYSPSNEGWVRRVEKQLAGIASHGRTHGERSREHRIRTLSWMFMRRVVYVLERADA